MDTCSNAAIASYISNIPQHDIARCDYTGLEILLSIMTEQLASRLRMSLELISLLGVPWVPTSCLLLLQSS